MKRVNKDLFQKIIYLSVSLILFINFSSCEMENKYYSNEDKRNLFLTMIVKSGECGGNFPQLPIFPIKKEIPLYAVQACNLAIIQSPCPVLEYPLVCIEMFQIDIPNLGPKIVKTD